MTFPQNYFLGNVLPYQDDFLLKTKMVRMVHMNILYRMDLEICDSKWVIDENWKLRFSKNWKKQFWDPKPTFDLVSKVGRPEQNLWRGIKESNFDLASKVISLKQNIEKRIQESIFDLASKVYSLRQDLGKQIR